ncbi:T-diRNAhydrouridine synthase [Operophtera brumata]|uniref:tRNA-dihydrouridine(16/17) synthase [NAD(P)(+)] n=1 Tax=Operophtera brumata TaxID=104452 RepID=A0A0L7KQ81_OPEBR|nr:T-diRNAhydrouridine synthase [Operophtera brumata]
MNKLLKGASKMQVGHLDPKNWKTWKCKIQVVLRAMPGAVDIVEGRRHRPTLTASPGADKNTTSLNDSREGTDQICDQQDETGLVPDIEGDVLEEQDPLTEQPVEIETESGSEEYLSPEEIENENQSKALKMSKEWFQSIGSPRYVVAPMVDASELAWRLLCRRHCATLCYTPMFHSQVFTKDPKYRKDNMQTCVEDRPLIVQFCGNDPATMAAAAKMVEPHCDAIDINLGCPQSIAKRGHYGSFLQDEWVLLQKIVAAMSKAVSIPITCKVRVFESIEKSVEYAVMLQKAGCKLLTVHGRTRDQKGPLTGIASWKHIKAVRCIEYTNVDGVMSAEGNLTNPAIFEGINPVSWEIAKEYLDLVETYPCPMSFIRGHLFKIFHKIFTFEENNGVRQILATGQNLDDFKQVCGNIREKYLPYHEGQKQCGFDLILPPWICQPYVRMSPENYTYKMEQLSSNQGGKCVYKLCKKCCRNKCFEEELDCSGHRILVFTRRQTAKRLANKDVVSEAMAVDNV